MPVEAQWCIGIHHDVLSQCFQCELALFDWFHVWIRLVSAQKFIPVTSSGVGEEKGREVLCVGKSIDCPDPYIPHTVVAVI